jgi:uncharacterized membrane protein YeiH
LVEPWLSHLDEQRALTSSGFAWHYFDYGASFIWAASGALLAARRGFDLTGIFAIALVSSTGGGLIRDGLFLQQGPPVLVRSSAYIAIAAGAALLVWSIGRNLQHLRAFTRIAAVADAVGLGGFAVVGMDLATRAGLSLPGVVLVGVVNAVGGGLLRNLLLYETPEIFRPGELTALAALSGCLLHVLLTSAFGTDEHIAAGATVGLVSALRFASVKYGLRTRPARGFPLSSERGEDSTAHDPP